MEWESLCYNVLVIVDDYGTNACLGAESPEEKNNSKENEDI